MSLSSASTAAPKYRLGGTSTTVLLRPLHSSLDELDVQTLVSRISLNAPLRVDHFRYRAESESWCGFAYVTFPSHADAELVVTKLNNVRSPVDSDSINLMSSARPKRREQQSTESALGDDLSAPFLLASFSALPRDDLKGKTAMTELGCSKPGLTRMDDVMEALSAMSKLGAGFKHTPARVDSAPGHGHVKHKWVLWWKTPEIAKLAVELFSGLIHENRFVIMGYQLDRRDTVHDKKECFLGISNRVVLHNIPHFVRGTQLVVSFLTEKGGFSVSGPGSLKRDAVDKLRAEGGNDAVAKALTATDTDVVDIDLKQQCADGCQMLRGGIKGKGSQMIRGGKGKGSVRPKRGRATGKGGFKARLKSGMAIVTFASRELAAKAYTKLDGKMLRIAKSDGTFAKYKLETGLAPHSTDTPMKESLKNNSRVVHISNVPWFVGNGALKHFIRNAGVENADGSVDGAETLPNPIRVFCRYRDGYRIGRYNATFMTPEDATRVVEKLNGVFLADRPLRFNWAHEFVSLESDEAETSEMKTIAPKTELKTKPLRKRKFSEGGFDHTDVSTATKKIKLNA